MRKVMTILPLLLLLVSMLVGLLVGANALRIGDLIALMQGTAAPVKALLFWDFRLPRLLIALLGGGALAASSYLLQGVTRNELADSSILGVNSGISLFVMIYLGFFPQGTAYHLPLVGFIGGILAAFLVFMIAFKRQQRLSMNKLLLSGIAVNAGLNALTILVTIAISKDSYVFVGNFLAGSIWGASWQQIMILAPWVILGTLLAWIKVPMVKLLALGEEQVLSLGVKLDKERLQLMILAIALAAGGVAFTGSLSFVGLLAPHLAKGIYAGENRHSFSQSLVFGGLLVLVADIIGRVILPVGEVPAGIMIALIGAPYFLLMMLRKKPATE